MHIGIQWLSAPGSKVEETSLFFGPLTTSSKAITNWCLFTNFLNDFMARTSERHKKRTRYDEQWWTWSKKLRFNRFHWIQCDIRWFTRLLLASFKDLQSRSIRASLVEVQVTLWARSDCWKVGNDKHSNSHKNSLTKLFKESTKQGWSLICWTLPRNLSSKNAAILHQWSWASKDWPMRLRPKKRSKKSMEQTRETALEGGFHGPGNPKCSVNLKYLIY